MNIKFKSIVFASLCFTAMSCFAVNSNTKIKQIPLQIKNNTGDTYILTKKYDPNGCTGFMGGIVESKNTVSGYQQFWIQFLQTDITCGVKNNEFTFDLKNDRTHEATYLFFSAPANPFEGKSLKIVKYSKNNIKVWSYDQIVIDEPISK